MRITKKELLAAISSNSDFEVVKNDFKEINKEETETPVLAKWKGQIFYVSFNEESLPDEINNDDDIYNSVSSDFSISVVIKANHPFDNDICDDNVIDADVKYKIANYINRKSHLNSVVIYREDADLFLISVRHSVFLRERVAHQINGAIMTMVLTCVVTSQKTRAAIEEYRESPEAFLEKCKGGSNEE